MRLSLMILLVILVTSCKIRHDKSTDSTIVSSKRYKQDYRLDWDKLSEVNKIVYLQFNFDQFPMDDTYKISIIDSFKIGKGLFLNNSESKKLMELITDSSNFNEGQCGTFYINAGFVILKNDTIIGTIEIGCGFGQWRFNPKNKYSNDNLLSDKGFESMSKLLDEINLRDKNARTHNTVLSINVVYRLTKRSNSILVSASWENDSLRTSATHMRNVMAKL